MDTENPQPHDADKNPVKVYTFYWYEQLGAPIMTTEISNCLTHDHGITSSGPTVFGVPVFGNIPILIRKPEQLHPVPANATAFLDRAPRGFFRVKATGCSGRIVTYLNGREKCIGISFRPEYDVANYYSPEEIEEADGPWLDKKLARRVAQITITEVLSLMLSGITKPAERVSDEEIIERVMAQLEDTKR